MKTTRLKINRWIFPGTKRFFIKNIQNRRRMEKTRLKIDRWIFSWDEQVFYPTITNEFNETMERFHDDRKRQWHNYAIFSTLFFFPGTTEISEIFTMIRIFPGADRFFFYKGRQEFLLSEGSSLHSQIFCPQHPTSQHLFFFIFLFFYFFHVLNLFDVECLWIGLLFACKWYILIRMTKQWRCNLIMGIPSPLWYELAYKTDDDLSIHLDGILDGSGREVSIYVAVRIR